MKWPASRAGTNIYTHHCKSLDRQASYAICLFTIQAFMERRLSGFADCRGCLKTKKCPAVRMLKKEMEAGKALYVKKRPKTAAATKRKLVVRKSMKLIKSISEINADWIAKRRDSMEYPEMPAFLKREQPDKPSKEPVKKAGPKSPVKGKEKQRGKAGRLDIKTGDYADAINKAVEKERNK